MSVLSAKDALSLYKQGKEKWNQWVRENQNAFIDFKGVDFTEELIFKGFDFPEVDFSGSTFLEKVRFESLDFMNKAIFKNTTFHKELSFNKVYFQKGIYFDYSTFESNFSVSDSIFDSGCYLDKSIINRFSLSGCNVGGGLECDTLTVKSEFSCTYNYFSQIAHFSGSTFSKNTNFRNNTVKLGVAFSQCTFNSHCSFSNNTFGFANFYKAKFLSEFDANKTVFKDQVNFAEAIFSSDVIFENSVFNSKADFAKIKSDGVLNFKNADFQSKTEEVSFENANIYYLILSYSKFKRPPTFYNYTFDKGLSVYDVEVNHEMQSFLGANEKGTSLIGDAEKYCSIKKMASLANDPRTERRFLGYELLAQQYENKLTFLEQLSVWAYHHSSNFGQSLFKPLAGLFLTSIIFCIFFQYILSFNGESYSFSKAYIFSLSQLVPFFGISKFSKDEIYEWVEMQGENFNSWFYLLGYLENFLGILFVFLFVLALRNKFRL